MSMDFGPKFPPEINTDDDPGTLQQAPEQEETSVAKERERYNAEDDDSLWEPPIIPPIVPDNVSDKD